MDDLFVGGFGGAVGDVVANCGGEEFVVLEDEGNMGANVVVRKVGVVLVGNFDRSKGGVVEFEDKIDKGGFAGP